MHELCNNMRKHEGEMYERKGRLDHLAHLTDS